MTVPRTRVATPALLGLLLSLALGLPGERLPGAHAGDPAPRPGPGPAPVEVERELRRILRGELPLAERLEAAERALAAPPGRGEPDAWLRASEALLVPAPEPAAWLARRGLAEGEASEAARSRLRRALAGRVPGSPAEAALGDALGLLLGARRPAALHGVWPPGPFVRAVLEDELGQAPGPAGTPVLAVAGAAELSALLARLAPAAEALDRATSLAAAESEAGLDALLGLGEEALPLLLHEARRAAVGVPAGRLDRALKALAVLGLRGDRAATPALIACLESPHGFVRAAAATALGDLRDPAAAVALARQLVYAGDPFRARESWDYPGTTETTVRPEDWPSVEYYAIDVAAADALLELGARGAAAWLLRNALDPRRRNLRIRVPQDALDALRRHLPAQAPLQGYEVEASLGRREAAWLRLSAWWREHRDDPGLLRRPFDEQDAGFQRAGRALAERLGQPKVLELMIAKDACEVIGPPLTPLLVEALSTARHGGARAELASALGRVRDPRAVPALLSLLAERAGFLRAKAAEALGAYAATSAQAVQALLGALSDPDCGCRQAALGALAGAPVSEAVREALRAHPPERFAEGCGESPGYVCAYEVARLAQEGEAHLPAVLAGLGSADRVVRRSWWDLLRLALDLEERDFDWAPAPGSPSARPPDAGLLRAALARRRGAR